MKGINSLQVFLSKVDHISHQTQLQAKLTSRYPLIKLNLAKGRKEYLKVCQPELPEKNTPPKFYIAPKRWCLEDECPFGIAYFQELYQISGGVSPFWGGILFPSNFSFGRGDFRWRHSFSIGGLLRSFNANLETYPSLGGSSLFSRWLTTVNKSPKVGLREPFQNGLNWSKWLLNWGWRLKPR